MSKQGIYKISGNTKPKVGELVTYKIDEWYPATPLAKRNPALVTWHLFKKVNGKFVPTTIKKVGVSSFTFNTNAYKDTFRIEAYLHSPEGRAPMALEVQPQPSDVPRINKVELKYIDDTPGTVFSFTEKLIAEASCMNLEGQYLMFTLWEDDSRDSGHNNSNQSIENKRAKVINGTARAEFMLTKALMKKAMEGEANPEQLEFYVTVEYYSHKKHATNNVNVNTPAELRTPSGQPQQPQPQPQPQQPAQPQPQPQPQPAQPQQPAPSPAQPEPEPQSAHGTAHNTQPPTPAAPGGVSPSTVDPVKIEELLDAYFAKKEYIKETGEEDGTHTYTFGGSKSGNKTSTAEEKNKVAQTILNKIKESLKAQKKYTTLEVIAAALTAEAYGKDTTNQKTVTFKTFKLGADYKKVDSAPLDSKLYLVARTMLLDGKQVTISIKEKDGLIKGAADAVLPVLEITEEQIDQKTPAGQAVPGTEKTVFTATVQNNLVKIPIHLRPKSEEDLKQWQDKLSKGKEDGTYTYTFGGATNITNEAQKASIAKTILANAQKGNAKNPKIENGKTSSEEEIKKVLEIKNYSEGNTITFKLLKKVPEFLYLHAKAQGTKQHDKKFLNKDGAYFEIGSKHGCLIDEEYFINIYQQEFPQKDKSGKVIPLQESVKTNFKKIFKSIFEYFKNEQRCCNLKQIAYLLATAKHETGDTFNPVEEANWLSWNTRKKYFEDMYDPVLGKDENRRSMATSNENTKKGDGEKYFGRGYVQLTWKKNYRRMTEKFGVDFVNQRDLALDHEWAMKILIYGSEEGIFTGKKLSDYIDSTADYVNARRVINGTDKASTIAGYAEKIEKCLKIECNCNDTPKTNTKKGYDIDKAVEYIIAHAKTQKPYGDCALYVRKAINAGGIKGSWGDAWQYLTALPSIGFTDLGKITDFVKGDIVVFDKTGGRKWGHIAMWDGSQWVSDFKQKSILVHDDYIGKNYHVFRWK